MKVDSKNFSRRFVIPDIHGCSETLKQLIKKIDLTKDDALFFLGDYIDRGHDSSGVIDFIIDLKEKGYNVFTISGNHEKEFLDAANEYEKSFFYKYVKRILKSDDLLNSDGSIIQKYKLFFENLVDYIELEEFILVHGGLNFDNEDIFADKRAIFYLRFWEPDESKLNGKKIVHGHQPTHYYEICRFVENRVSKIPLDNGCIYNRPHKVYDYTKLGKLCCLELNMMELTFFENADI